MALRSILRAFPVSQGRSAEFQRNTLTESYLRPVTVIASERRRFGVQETGYD